MEKTSKDKAQNNKYKDSFKSTIIFSGVEVFGILIRVIRSKFVAMFIGPTGMGITSLLHSTTDLISTATNLGIKTSGVRTVASASTDNDLETVQRTIAVVRRWILLTGTLGALICALFSPVWSQSSFGNREYIWSFVAVSLVILFDQIGNGERVLLQGLRKKRMLAKASIIGQCVGLLFTIPLYYFYGIKAIVLVLVLSSLLTASLNLYFTSRLGIKRVKVSFRETWSIGGEMIKLGVLLSLSNILSQIAVYVVRTYVSSTGGLDDVGLYSAGTSIVNIYLGMVFSAMATDYFPRLAGTKTKVEFQDTIRSQAEISMLLFTPLIIAFVVFIKPVIILLYSDRFLPIEQMMYWSLSATLIKAFAWSLSYAVVAKAKKSIYFWNEAASIIYTMIFNIIGYKYWGLTGFGISMVVSYTIYLIQMLFVTRRYLDSNVSTETWKLFASLNIPVLISLAIIIFCKTELMKYTLGVLILVISSYIVFKEMDRRIQIKSFIQTKIHRNDK